MEFLDRINRINRIDRIKKGAEIIKKRILLVASVSIIAVTLVFAGYVFVRVNPFGWFVVTTDAFTREGWASIRKRQTMAEVEAVLGTPFNIVECDKTAQCDFYWLYSRKAFAWMLLWRKFIVFFDSEGRVMNKLEAVEDD